ncbi:hypothetical protein GFS60_06418 (plasmid) [Rhodococcus sp. WAY2]|nr:hypothetical protein GFS60_06418 [Rhodococcus sp. WAY2]
MSAWTGSYAHTYLILAAARRGRRPDRRRQQPQPPHDRFHHPTPGGQLN